MKRPLRLGTRGSPLALAQARSVARALEALDEQPVEIVVVTTTGDRVQDRPLAEIGGKALWTKELDRALLADEVDCCVHSMKDVESERPERLRLAAMLDRADVRDRLIGAESIAALAEGARIGTSSPRRTAQLLRLRPDLNVEMLRGNVETRLRRVASRDVDATLLAAAGLDRLGIATGIALDIAQLLPAPGQAAVGIECRAEDDETMARLGSIGDRETMACVLIERAFTRALGATCASPVAALATCDGDVISLRAELLSADGRDAVGGSIRCSADDEEPARAFAEALLADAPPSIKSLFEVP